MQNVGHHSIFLYVLIPGNNANLCSSVTNKIGRQPKSIDLIQDYEDITTFTKPNQECRSALYSDNGEYFAYTQPHQVVVVKADVHATPVATIEVNDTFDLHFSPNGSYVALWTKPILINKESGIWTENILIYHIKSHKVVYKWTNKQQNGWKPQFTQDEKLFAKNFNNKEIHFFKLSENLTEETGDLKINKPDFKFKFNDASVNFQNFQISPGLNPSIAIFVPEKNGKPAQVFLYNISNFNQPLTTKTFFKAERCQLKWNSIGTALLALASIDHDTSNKSYYGESNLYLLGIAGTYDSRIDLKREGPIHDITWSPSAREFAVIYGYMPSETTFFDARGNSIYSLPTQPRNTILYSPHARFILVAGFGNLQGTVDIYDRQNKFSKVASFEAANTSVCEWSPCGRFILTATTSPRLRVDNGLKVWHASGKLVYMRNYLELYSIAWKPQTVDKFPALRNLEADFNVHPSAKEWNDNHQIKLANASQKPTGAYRPPHARGSGGNRATTSLYEKELASATAPVIRQKTIPGATPVVKESKTAMKNRKKREQKKDSPAPQEQSPAPASAPAPATTPATTPAAVGSIVGGTGSLEDKKIRSLLKKLRAIEILKMKQANGDPLEDTQVNKIKKEDEIRKELTSLGWSDKSI